MPVNEIRSGYTNTEYTKVELDIIAGRREPDAIKRPKTDTRRGPFNGHVEFFRFFFNADTAFDTNGKNFWPDEETNPSIAGFRILRSYRPIRVARPRPRPAPQARLTRTDLYHRLRAYT